MTVRCMYQDGEYLQHNPDWHAADAPLKAQWIADLLACHAVAPASIAEVGCGSGEILARLANVFPQAQLSGYDISPQAHAIARTRQTDRLSVYLSDFLQAQVPCFDLVMAIDVFEHVDDYMGFLRALKKKGRWQVFHIPLDLSVQGILRGASIMRARTTLGHLHYFTQETALATLRDCGFEVVGWKYTFGAEQLPDRRLTTRLTNLLRAPLRRMSEKWAVRVLGGASLLVLTR